MINGNEWVKSRDRSRSSFCFFLSHGAGEVDFVAQRNAEITGSWHLRLTLPRPVHRPRAEGGQAEPAALVAAERADGVVGGGQRDLMAALQLGLDPDRLDELRADALLEVEGVDRDD